MRRRAEAVVREHPLLAVACAAGAGALLGGVLMRNAGRLVFIAAASAAAFDLWKSEGGVDLRELLDRLGGGEASESESKRRTGLA
jgi:hypothetical protein